MNKTNAIRILEQKNIAYIVHEYDSRITDGISVAKALNEDAHKVFKTLVTQYGLNKYAVFIVPVCTTLNLKKAAEEIKAKSVEMIKQKDLLPLTGYIHGGCSPIGMKKEFITLVDESALLYETIYLSGGKVGLQIEIDPRNLNKVIKVKFVSLV